MDPDVTLAELLDLAGSVAARRGQQDIEENTALVQMTERVLALNDWILDGGFLPAAWQATAGAGPIAGCDADGEPVARSCVGSGTKSGVMRIRNGQWVALCKVCHEWIATPVSTLPDHPAAP